MKHQVPVMGDRGVHKIRILLVDQQTLMRAGLRLLLETAPDLQVVGEAQDARTALAKARDTSPDVALMELGVPGMGGLTVIEQLRQQCPLTRVLVLSPYADVASVRAALSAGSSAYVNTRATPTDLLTAIRAVAAGYPFVDSTVASPLLADLLGQLTPGQAAAPGRPRSLLSPREREVLIRLAQGYTHRQIAEQIYVSVKSVETYRARIAQKLELHSRADLIRYAHASGIFTPEMFHWRLDDSTRNGSAS
jgi:DNA-binding NarL/FixJ family response regulator